MRTPKRGLGRAYIDAIPFIRGKFVIMGDADCTYDFRNLAPFIHDYKTVVIEMIPFVCTLAPASPEPHPHEHVALAWVKPGEFTRFDLAAADWPVVRALEALPWKTESAGKP